VLGAVLLGGGGAHGHRLAAGTQLRERLLQRVSHLPARPQVRDHGSHRGAIRGGVEGAALRGREAGLEGIGGEDEPRRDRQVGRVEGGQRLGLASQLLARVCLSGASDEGHFLDSPYLTL
jgi:hypothetical protein